MGDMIVLLSASLAIGVVTGLSGSLPWAIILSLSVLAAGAASAAAAGHGLAGTIAFGFAALVVFQGSMVVAAILRETRTRLARKTDRTGAIFSRRRSDDVAAADSRPSH